MAGSRCIEKAFQLERVAEGRRPSDGCGRPGTAGRFPAVGRCSRRALPDCLPSGLAPVARHLSMMSDCQDDHRVSADEVNDAVGESSQHEASISFSVRSPALGRGTDGVDRTDNCGEKALRNDNAALRIPSDRIVDVSLSVCAEKDGKSAHRESRRFRTSVQDLRVTEPARIACLRARSSVRHASVTASVSSESRLSASARRSSERSAAGSASNSSSKASVRAFMTVPIRPRRKSSLAPSATAL